MNVGKISKDDWTAMYMESCILKTQDKVCSIILNHVNRKMVITEIYLLYSILNQVLYCQPYNPHAEEDKDKPFIIIIQDKWMLDMAMRFSLHNSWAIDSTFKTNVFGLPLYAAVLPNQHGVGMPIWFMMCTNDPGSNQESVALEITLKTIFSKMNHVRPTALVIDKSQQELDAFIKVINEDPYCWGYEGQGNRIQISCHVIVCWFHTKKAWVENLLPKVNVTMLS